MDKRYQVFVSSTYADLRDERRRVIQTLMEMDCIPAGMELFPAADEEQWQFIRKVIDDCDYYILIIGGRYGSTTAEGISYTEKEYDYAIEKNLKVLAYIHEKPEEIPAGKSEAEPQLRDRLEAFRQKVSRGRLVKTWTSATDLPGLVALSLSKTIKTYPAVGWVRADQVAATDVLSELNTLRKRNEELERMASKIAPKAPTPMVQNLAGLDEKIKLSGTTSVSYQKFPWSLTITWRDLFSLIAPHLLEHPNEAHMRGVLGSSLNRRSGGNGPNPSLDPDDFQTVKVQLMALGLVDVQFTPTIQGGMALFWTLTPRGREVMFSLRTVKAAKST